MSELQNCGGGHEMVYDKQVVVGGNLNEISRDNIKCELGRGIPNNAILAIDNIGNILRQSC